MVQFLSIFFVVEFLQFLLGFSKVPVFVSHCTITAIFSAHTKIRPLKQRR